MEIFIAHVEPDKKKICVRRVKAKEKDDTLFYHEGQIIKTIPKIRLGRPYDHEGFGNTPESAAEALRKGLQYKIDKEKKRIKYLQEWQKFEIEIERDN